MMIMMIMMTMMMIMNSNSCKSFASLLPHNSLLRYRCSSTPSSPRRIPSPRPSCFLCQIACFLSWQWGLLSYFPCIDDPCEGVYDLPEAATRSQPSCLFIQIIRTSARYALITIIIDYHHHHHHHWPWSLSCIEIDPQAVPSLPPYAFIVIDHHFISPSLTIISYLAPLFPNPLTTSPTSLKTVSLYPLLSSPSHSSLLGCCKPHSHGWRHGWFPVQSQWSRLCNHSQQPR